MGDSRKTRSPVYVRLPERRIKLIEQLVADWSFETRLFVLRRLRQYDPHRSPLDVLTSTLRKLLKPIDHQFQVLRDPEQLGDWRGRFQVVGSQNATAAWNKILRRELSWHDYQYLTYLLEKKTSDIFVPERFRTLLDKIYHAHILKEYTEDPDVPRAALVLVIGPSGSGKSATVKQGLEEAIFVNEIRAVIDLQVKRDEVLANEPIWRSLEEVDPELAIRIERRRKVEQLRLIAKLPLIKYLFRARIGRALSALEEEGVFVDYAMVTPNDYQTAWAGEPGNYLRKAMGDPQKTSIRHLEEAHAAFGRPIDGMVSSAAQQTTLVDAANIVLDEIAFGKRDCLLIATTSQPELFDAAIYRRFVERGLVIDVSDYWRDTENLSAIVRTELKRHNLVSELDEQDDSVAQALIAATVRRLEPLFRERSLRITPAYVRRLIDSLIGMKGDLRAEYLDDQFLVRDALKAVARNVYGSLYNKVVGHMDRGIEWRDYIGAIKDEFSEMANNSLYYHVSEEKGVVLTGPPGSGKTFMVRAWLGDNREVQDLVVNLNDLSDPRRPVDGMVENLERVYDIAKMLSPSMVFFDEGDSVAPRRSSQGGSPYDKVTNKFLSLIDGESPLNRVFTVLTTNRLDILDPALIRSKRLKVMNVNGHLRDEDILRILRKELRDLPLEDHLNLDEMIHAVRGLCETPADFTAYAEKVRSLRSTEVEVLEKMLVAVAGGRKERTLFVRFNYRVLVGLLESVVGDDELAFQARRGEDMLVEHLDEVAKRLAAAAKAENYPLTHWHFQVARQQLAASPLRKGKQQLDEFLETELSEEPQIGFVVGVGANDTSGVLLPIASSLLYKIFPDKVMVTGAVSTAAPAAAEMDLAVQMTRQSAHEALTLVENYLQSVCPEMNVARVLGDFLSGYSLHHQLLSASYSVGGPSAGFALAINTLSVLLQLPVLNDFGITGAPWTKGPKKGEVGSSVIIGGHQKKTEKVLQYLARMYLPVQNYQDLELEVLEAYRVEKRDIRPVTSFSALVPEVFCFDEFSHQRLQTFLDSRREEDLRPQSIDKAKSLERLGKEWAEIRRGAEHEIHRRMLAIQGYSHDVRKPYGSLESIFRQPRVLVDAGRNG